MKRKHPRPRSWGYAAEISMRGKDFLEAARRRKELTQVEVRYRDLLRFSLNEEWYGLDIVDVVEVIRYPKVFRIPHTPDYIVGVVNLRGEILSIVDIRKLLRLSANAPANATTKSSEQKHIVVVERNNVKIGILVDRAYDVVSIPDSDIKPPLSSAGTDAAVYADRARNFIVGEAQLRGDVLAILNLGALIEEGDRRVTA